MARANPWEKGSHSLSISYNWEECLEVVAVPPLIRTLQPQALNVSKLG